jgi:hypothetical protein
MGNMPSRRWRRRISAALLLPGTLLQLALVGSAPGCSTSNEVEQAGAHEHHDGMSTSVHMNTPAGEILIEAPQSSQPAQAPCAAMAGCACALPVRQAVSTSVDSSVARISLVVPTLHGAVLSGLTPPPRA